MAEDKRRMLPTITLLPRSKKSDGASYISQHPDKDGYNGYVSMGPGLDGRARALSMALGHLDYYRDTNP